MFITSALKLSDDPQLEFCHLEVLVEPSREGSGESPGVATGWATSPVGFTLPGLSEEDSAPSAGCKPAAQAA